MEYGQGKHYETIRVHTKRGNEYERQQLVGSEIKAKQTTSSKESASEGETDTKNVVEFNSNAVNQAIDQAPKEAFNSDGTLNRDYFQSKGIKRVANEYSNTNFDLMQKWARQKGSNATTQEGKDEAYSRAVEAFANGLTNFAKYRANGGEGKPLIAFVQAQLKGVASDVAFADLTVKAGVKIPIRQARLMYKLNNTIDVLKKQLGTPPSEEQILSAKIKEDKIIFPNEKGYKEADYLFNITNKMIGRTKNEEEQIPNENTLSDTVTKEIERIDNKINRAKKKNEIELSNIDTREKELVALRGDLGQKAKDLSVIKTKELKEELGSLRKKYKDADNPILKTKMDDLEAAIRAVSDSDFNNSDYPNSIKEEFVKIASSIKTINDKIERLSSERVNSNDVLNNIITLNEAKKEALIREKGLFGKRELIRVLFGAKQTKESLDVVSGRKQKEGEAQPARFDVIDTTTDTKTHNYIDKIEEHKKDLINIVNKMAGEDEVSKKILELALGLGANNIPIDTWNISKLLKGTGLFSPQRMLIEYGGKKYQVSKFKRLKKVNEEDKARIIKEQTPLMNEQAINMRVRAMLPKLLKDLAREAGDNKFLKMRLAELHKSFDLGEISNFFYRCFVKAFE